MEWDGIDGIREKNIHLCGGTEFGGISDEHLSFGASLIFIFIFQDKKIHIIIGLLK